MIPSRREDRGVEELPDCFGIQVPPCLDARIRFTIEQEAHDTHELLKDRMREKLEKKIKVLRTSRGSFQDLFTRRVIDEPEFEPCEVTNRVYLIATGRPNRDTYDIQDKKLKGLGEEYRRDLQTTVEEVDNLTFAFTEVSWTEYRTSVQKAQDLPPGAGEALAQYFDLNISFVPGILAALESYTHDEILRIAMYADKNAS